MKEMIKKLVHRIFPDLAGGFLHPRLGRVVKVGLNKGKSSELNPLHCVDVQLLNDDYTPADFPVLEAVPVSMPGAGQNRGFSVLPEVGVLVEIGFLNGSAALPFVRAVLPYELTLPEGNARVQLWQQNPNNAIRLSDDAVQLQTPMTVATGNLQVKSAASGVVIAGGRMLIIDQGIVTQIL